MLNLSSSIFAVAVVTHAVLLHLTCFAPARAQNYPIRPVEKQPADLSKPNTPQPVLLEKETDNRTIINNETNSSIVATRRDPQNIFNMTDNNIGTTGKPPNQTSVKPETHSDSKIQDSNGFVIYPSSSNATEGATETPGNSFPFNPNNSGRNTLPKKSSETNNSEISNEVTGIFNSTGYTTDSSEIPGDLEKNTSTVRFDPNNLQRNQQPEQNSKINIPTLVNGDGDSNSDSYSNSDPSGKINGESNDVPNHAVPSGFKNLRNNSLPNPMESADNSENSSVTTASSAVNAEIKDTLRNKVYSGPNYVIRKNEIEEQSTTQDTDISNQRDPKLVRVDPNSGRQDQLPTTNKPDISNQLPDPIVENSVTTETPLTGRPNRERPHSVQFHSNNLGHNLLPVQTSNTESSERSTSLTASDDNNNPKPTPFNPNNIGPNRKSEQMITSTELNDFPEKRDLTSRSLNHPVKVTLPNQVSSKPNNFKSNWQLEHSSATNNTDTSNEGNDQDTQTILETSSFNSNNIGQNYQPLEMPKTNNQQNSNLMNTPVVNSKDNSIPGGVKQALPHAVHFNSRNVGSILKPPTKDGNNDNKDNMDSNATKDDNDNNDSNDNNGNRDKIFNNDDNDNSIRPNNQQLKSTTTGTPGAPNEIMDVFNQRNSTPGQFNPNNIGRNRPTEEHSTSENSVISEGLNQPVEKSSTKDISEFYATSTEVYTSPATNSGTFNPNNLRVGNNYPNPGTNLETDSSIKSWKPESRRKREILSNTVNLEPNVRYNFATRRFYFQKDKSDLKQNLELKENNGIVWSKQAVTISLNQEHEYVNFKLPTSNGNLNQEKSIPYEKYDVSEQPNLFGPFHDENNNNGLQMPWHSDYTPSSSDLEYQSSVNLNRENWQDSSLQQEHFRRSTPSLASGGPPIAPAGILT